MEIRGKREIIIAVGATVAVCAIIGALLFLFLPRPDPAKALAQNVVDQVAVHLVLPEDEAPTVATVSSLEQLAGQPFFVNAKVGDKVLIYTKAKKAILYDPVIDKIVEVAPLSTQ